MTKIKKIFFDNRKEEALLGKNILSLSEPKSKISLSVKKQYEENPYPRWSIIEIPKQQSLSSYANFHNLDFSSVNKERNRESQKGKTHKS